MRLHGRRRLATNAIFAKEPVVKEIPRIVKNERVPEDFFFKHVTNRPAVAGKLTLHEVEFYHVSFLPNV